MRADQEGYEKLADAIIDERGDGDAHGHVPVGGFLRQDPQHFAKADLLAVLHLCRIGIAARRLGDGQLDDRRDDEAGHADNGKGHPPALDILPVERIDRPGPVPAGQQRADDRPVETADDIAAEHIGDHAAERDAQRVNRHGGRTLRRDEIVGDQRIGRRRTARLADADADAEDEQGNEAGSKAAQYGHQAPQEHRSGDDPDPVMFLGETRDRDADKGVEDGKGGAAEQPHLPVFHPEAFLDRLGQDIDDRAVDEIEDIDGQQDAENIVAIAPAAIAGFRRPAGRGTGYAGHCCFGQMQTPLMVPDGPPVQQIVTYRIVLTRYRNFPLCIFR